MITLNGCYYWYEISVIKDKDGSLSKEKIRIPVQCKHSGEYSSICIYIDPLTELVVTHTLSNELLSEIPDNDKTVFMHNLEHIKPPANTTVLFVWWNRNGFEASQKTLGIMHSNGELKLDFNPAGKEKPRFWAHLTACL